MTIECPRLKSKSSYIRLETEIEPYIEQAESNYLDKYIKSNRAISGITQKMGIELRRVYGQIVEVKISKDLQGDVLIFQKNIRKMSHIN